jgi:Big-like domain-containing protein
LNTVIVLGVLAGLSILGFSLLNIGEVMTLPEKKGFLFYDVIYASSDNGTNYSTGVENEDEAAQDLGSEQVTTVHDSDNPISADSLELIISNSTVPRNTNFLITAGVMAHRTGNVDTFWNLELLVPLGYEITDSNDTSGHQNTTSHAHGKANVTWAIVSRLAPSEHPDTFRVTAMAYDADTGILLKDSPISTDYELTTVNMNPTANNDNFSANEDTPIEMPLLQNDFDADGDVLMISEILRGPTNGIVISNDNSSLTVYNPNDNFFGNDTFTYTIRDIYNGTSFAEVNINVIPVNDPPVAVYDHVATQEDTPIDIDVLENDYDPDNNVNGSDIHESIEVVMVSSPSNGTAVLHPVNSTVITYIPSGNFSGNDTFDYVITDGSLNSTGKVMVVVEPVNDVPGARPGNFTTIENQNIDIVLNGCDPDGDQLSFEVVGAPSNGNLGALSVSGLATAHVIYTPNRNYHGTDSFTFLTSDGIIDSSVATVSIVVTPSNSTDGSNDIDDNDEPHAGRGGSSHNGKNSEAESPNDNVDGSEDRFEKLVVTSYKMLDKDGKVITCIDQGTKATFSYVVANSGLADYDCLLIWELVDEDGVARNIQINQITVPRIVSTTYDNIIWSGDELGKYQVQLFLWTDLAIPTPLSKPFMYEFTVKRQ